MFDFLAQLRAHDVGAYAALLCAGAFLSVSRSAHGERNHVWLALGAALVACSWMLQRGVPAIASRVSYAELPWQLVNVVGTAVAWYGVFGHLRVPRPWQLRFALFLLAWLLASLAFVVAVIVLGIPVTRSVAYLPITASAALLASICFWSAQREPGLGQRLMGCAMLGIPLLVAAGAASGTEAAYLRYMNLASFLLVCMVTLQGGYVREQRRLAGVQRDLKRASDELECRVAERTAELAAARDLAQAGERAKGRFVALMSHEIRTPITGLVGTIELMRRTADPAEQRALLCSAEAAAQQLRVLLDGVVDLSKLDAGALPLDFRALDLHALCRSVLDQHAPAASQRGLQLRLELAGAARAMRSDAQRIRQVLDHLVRNAVAYTGSGEVLVEAQTAPADAAGADPALWLLLRVSDRGPGVPPGRSESIFEPFEQGDCMPIAERAHAGAGLGLALGRRLARALGGDLVYRPRDGGGSVFEGRFMVVAADPAELPQADAPPAVPPRADNLLAGHLLLVADDNPIVQTMLRRVLQREGAQVASVSDGTEALAQLQRRRFDAVLMDVSMPRLNGMAATQAIRALPALRGLPVIGISAHAMAGDREECLAAGMNAYLTKPLTREELLGALRAALPG